MKTYAAGFDNSISTWRAMSLFAAGVVIFSLPVLSAQAQVNRSRPPSPPPSGSGSSGSRPASPPSAPRSSGSGSNTGSSSGAGSSVDRGRTPSITGRGTGSGGSPAADKLNGTDRGGNSSQDRFNRSKEGTDAKTPNGKSDRVLYYPYYPYGGYYDPFGYPGNYPNSYPYPDTYSYPAPGRGRGIEARYNSPYFYCEDFTSGLYVSGRAVTIAPPKKLYVPTPIYRDQQINGWRNLDAKDYLQDRNAEAGAYRISEKNAAPDAALEEAIKDIVLSWQKQDIETLARHLRRDQLMAVILRDKYRYSLEGGDFLDMTLDALTSVSTPRFVLDHIHRKAESVYTLTGRHLFTDKETKERAAYISYVLTKIEDTYIITQIGAAPDRE